MDVEIRTFKQEVEESLTIIAEKYQTSTINAIFDILSIIDESLFNLSMDGCSDFIDALHIVKEQKLLADKLSNALIDTFKTHKGSSHLIQLNALIITVKAYADVLKDVNE